MFDHDRQLHEIAIRNKGVVARTVALAAGIPVWVIDDRVRAGVLIPMHDGIYRHAAAPFTQDLRDLAAVLACGDDAALSHRSAAARHHFPNIRRSRPEVTSPHRDLPRVPGVTRHRSLRLHPSDLVIVDGIRMTSKGRTAMDLCAVLPLHVTSECISEAVITKVVKPEALVATIERSGGRGCPGTADLRMITLALDEIHDLESVLELVVVRAVERAAVPRPDRQVPFTCADGRKVRFDLAWLDRRVALDANGRRWHDTPARRKRTRERHESIVASGIMHLEVGWAVAVEEPHLLIAEVEAAHAAFEANAA